MTSDQMKRLLMDAIEQALSRSIPEGLCIRRITETDLSIVGFMPDGAPQRITYRVSIKGVWA